MFKTTPPYIVASAVYVDLPLDETGKTVIDQVTESPHPLGRWESIAIQLSEVGKAGSLRYQVMVSNDAVNWTRIAGVIHDETSGEHVYVDINPGGMEQDHFTNKHGEGYFLSFRYWKIQVLSPSVNPNQHAVAAAVIYAR